MKQYVISAQRTSGEAVYYVSTNAEKMVPNAPSIAYRFSTLADALAGIGDLRRTYAGLSDWKAEVAR